MTSIIEIDPGFFNIVSTEIATALSNMAVQLVQGFWAALIILIYFVLGYLVAWIVNRLLAKAFEASKFEAKLKKKGLHDALLGVSFTSLVYSLVKFYIVVVFLGAAAARVDLGLVTEVITWLVGYLPSLVKGLVVVVGALFAADYVSDRIKGVRFAGAISALVKIFVGYTALVIAMPFLLPGADTEILKTAFTLAVSSVAVAFGLGIGIALGWGLKDTVGSIAKKKKGMLEKLL